MSKISEEVHQVNTVIGNIKLLYQDEKQITDKIDSLEDNIDAVDLMYRGQKNKSLTKWAKIAAVILEGILAYRASKFIFEFLLGIRIDLKFANLIQVVYNGFTFSKTNANKKSNILIKKPLGVTACIFFGK